MNRTAIILLALVLLSTGAFALDLPPGIIKLQEYQQNLALSITFLIAFIGGLITFTSPCGFVVLPTFFAYLFKERQRALFMTSVFCLGMTLAFVLFGLVAGAVGNFFNLYKEFFASISGGLLVLFGILLILNKGFSLFDFRVRHKPQDGWGVFFLGFFFAIGWTPCVGPILGGIILLAADTAHIWKGALLFGAYSLGVALPLLIVSYFSDRYDVAKWFQSKHITLAFFGKKIETHLYGIIGGILLIVIGLIMFFEQGTRLFMDKIPELVPWTMSYFTEVNEQLVASSFFTGTLANIIGIALAVGIIAFMLYAIWRRRFTPKTEH